MAAERTPVPERESLSGLVDRVTFHNPDNGFCVLRVKVRGHRDLVTVIGHAPSISVGEYVQASGRWEHHREHGRQFHAAFMKATAPDTVDGIEKYLGSGMIRGIGPIYARKLVRAFGERVFEVIEQAPARLREVPGIGPKRAERIAANWADQKVIRGIMVFLQSHGVGTARAVRIYRTYGADAIEGTRCIFLAHLWRAERTVAEILGRLVDEQPPWPAIDPGRAIPWVEGRLDVTLAEGQRAAIRRAVASKVTVITGGPGVGKTTLVNALLRILTAKGVRAALCAPTGRAAKRLSESTGREARTIHRLLEADPRSGGFKRDEDNPLEGDLVVVDETSMVDTPLMASLLRALPAHTALVLVGDVDQLPSVGPGQVLADVIASGAVPVARLTEIFRQAARSRIVVNAHRINAGELPPLAPPGEAEASDFYFVDAAEAEDAARKVVQIVRERIPRRFRLGPVRDVQVLCPMNRGALGARTLNLDLQAALNPPGAAAAVERFGWTYRVGDKVMQTENDYDKEVFNGDMGFIEAIDAEEGELTARFDDRPVTYLLGQLDRLAPAYATTVHKARGSEYPAMVVPLTMRHYPILRRNLIYTAVTRARRLLILVGERRALAVAVKGRRVERRWTRLRELLAGAAS